MSWRCLEDVLKKSWRRLEDVMKTYVQHKYIGLDQNVLKMSSEDVRLRRTYSSWSRRLEDEDERRLQDVFIKTNVCWEHCLYFSRSKPRSVFQHSKKDCRIFDGVNRIKTTHWKNHPKKTAFLFVLFRSRLKRMFEYAVCNWVVVTYGNQRFSGFVEDETVKILYFLPCKEEVLQKKD